MHAFPSLSHRHLPDEESTRALGAEIARAVGASRALIFLLGDLGAGKTTFAQGFLRERGWTGAVRSPTYPIVRSYPLEPAVHHFDLYRLGGLEEVLGLDFESTLDAEEIFLVEWPDRLEDEFRPDWSIELSAEAGGGRAAVVKRTGTPS